MSDKETIEKLLERIAMLENRVAMLEARGAQFGPLPKVSQPYPWEPIYSSISGAPICS